jgi:hypothetical protein
MVTDTSMPRGGQIVDDGVLILYTSTSTNLHLIVGKTKSCDIFVTYTTVSGKAARVSKPKVEDRPTICALIMPGSGTKRKSPT